MASNSQDANQSPLVAALRAYEQADPDGVMVNNVSRQALEEAAERIEMLEDVLNLVGLAPENWFSLYQVVAERAQPSDRDAIIEECALAVELKAGNGMFTFDALDCAAYIRALKKAAPQGSRTETPGSAKNSVDSNPGPVGAAPCVMETIVVPKPIGAFTINSTSVQLVYETFDAALSAFESIRPQCERR